MGDVKRKKGAWKMALINDIIRKYENQNSSQRYGNTQQQYAQNRDDIFLKVKPRGDPIGADRSAALGAGNLWKAQKVGLYEAAELVEDEPVQETAPQQSSELEELRRENAELKEQLAKLQMNYA